MGPRLLRAFRMDRGNKVVFGLFLATFTYCLRVLRAIGTDGDRPFVPEVGVIGAVGLAIDCVGGLVWFVHHAASSVDVMHVIAGVHRDALTALREASVPFGEPEEPGPDLTGPFSLALSDRGGYVQTVDRARLLRRASASGLSVRLLVRPGDYVPIHGPIAEVRPPVALKVADSLVIGERRTPDDDPEFAIRQLVEIAVRALSPAINDPYTAIAVLDRLGDAACSLRGRRLEGTRTGRAGSGCVTVPGTDADGLIDAMFLLVVQNGGRSPVVVIHALEILASVAECWDDPDARREVLRIADEAVALASGCDMHPRDVADVRERAARLDRFR